MTQRLGKISSLRFVAAWMHKNGIGLTVDDKTDLFEWM